MIAAIVALSRNGVIGKSGTLPWYLPADLRHFKDVTMGHPVIMGRTTFDSIVARLGHGLPGRLNIVLSTRADYSHDDAVVVSSIDEAIAATHGEDAFIIGGAQIYALAAEHIDTWYVTEIDSDIEGDVYLDSFDRPAFREVSRQSHAADDTNVYPYSFVVYERV